MQQAVLARAPAHLWIVGGLGLLWNGFGAYDYLMSRMRNTDYFKSMMPDVDPQAALNYIDGFPLWASFGWGLGVWLGLAGSVLLLIRSRHAVWAFALSLIGAILGLGYQLANPMPGIDGFMATGMPIVIIVVAAGLAWYSWSAQKKGLLR
jgi:hypothetical protein